MVVGMRATSLQENHDKSFSGARILHVNVLVYPALSTSLSALVSGSLWKLERATVEGGGGALALSGAAGQKMFPMLLLRGTGLARGPTLNTTQENIIFGKIAYFFVFNKNVARGSGVG
jgi:hypothetical protein